MLVIGRVMRRNRNGEAWMFSAQFARGKRLALHHRHLMLVLMDSIVHHVVDSGFGAQIARLELIHILSSGGPQGTMDRWRLIRYLPPRRSRQQQQ
jgi:hypothetical protein